MDDNTPEATGLDCFLDQGRPCGASCMAYLIPVDVPPGQDYMNKQWAHCSLLVGVHRLSKHAAILAQTLTRQAADQHRVGQPKPDLPR